MNQTEHLKKLLKTIVTKIEAGKADAATPEVIDNLFDRINITIDDAIDAAQQQTDSIIVDEMNSLLTKVCESGELEKFKASAMDVVEVRPEELVCDVVRFQNNKEKWVALVGLLDGRPYEIFTGLQDDDEGIVLPKTVTCGKIIKRVNSDGTKRYDFQFENRRGYKTTVEGLSEKFNPEYWNYAKLISGILRYRMPIENVIKLVGSMQMKTESINTWKNGVERALKKYSSEAEE